MKDLTICYIIGTYPDFSTTFIDREIRMMRQWGLNIRLLSIRQPVLHKALSQEQLSYQSQVIYLIPVQWLSFLAGHLHFWVMRPGSYLRTLMYLITRPHPSVRGRLMTLIHFAEGVYAAYLLRNHGVDHLHAHFVERAATVTLVVSRLLDIPYSLAIHAGGDIFVHPVLLPEKFAHAKFVISCTQYNLDYLKQQGIPNLDDKAFCIYHGLDFDRYLRTVEQDQPPLLLAVGQLVEKKGFEYLIKACRRLDDQGQELICHIIGPGAERQKLEQLITKLELQDTVKLLGALPHDQVVEHYQRATIFALPCIRSQDGDLDGIPNVLAEAMAAQLPVVSTRVSAIPELIQNEVNGLLVPPNDEPALATAIARLLNDPALRARIGEAGRQTIIEKFNIIQNVRAVYDVFVQQVIPKHTNP
jgi:glycosyltransferase involved in cell wall biosynthesis